MFVPPARPKCSWLQSSAGKGVLPQPVWPKQHVWSLVGEDNCRWQWKIMKTHESSRISKYMSSKISWHFHAFPLRADMWYVCKYLASWMLLQRPSVLEVLYEILLNVASAFHFPCCLCYLGEWNFDWTPQSSKWSKSYKKSLSSWSDRFWDPPPIFHVLTLLHVKVLLELRASWGSCSVATTWWNGKTKMNTSGATFISTWAPCINICEYNQIYKKNIYGTCKLDKYVRVLHS